MYEFSTLHVEEEHIDETKSNEDNQIFNQNR